MTDTAQSQESALQGQFAEGLDQDSAIKLAERVRDLEAENATFREQLEEFGALERDNAELKGKLEAAETKLTAAKKAAKVSTGEKAPGKPRALGPIDGADDATRTAALRKKIEAADKVEILFGDGKRDTGIPPAVVTGDAWADHARGLKLKEAVELHGPAYGVQSFSIAGYGLVIDGKLVAYTERPEPVLVGANQRVRLEDDIFF